MSDNTEQWSLFDEVTPAPTTDTMEVTELWRQAGVIPPEVQDEQVTMSVRLLARLLRDMQTGCR